MITYIYKFCILFLLFPVSIFSQEYIQVNTQYNKSNTNKELMIEIVNKSEVDVGISNMNPGFEYYSYFELCFYDKDGQQIPVSYDPPTFGVPFMNNLDGTKHSFLIKPQASLIFKYSNASLIHYCKEPDRIKKMKLKFHIKYYVIKDEKLVKKDIYEQFSETITF